MTTRSIDSAVAPGALAPPGRRRAAGLGRRAPRKMWRQRILPALGIVGLIALWWAVVALFDVKPFIAPSPWRWCCRRCSPSATCCSPTCCPRPWRPPAASCSATWRRCHRGHDLRAQQDAAGHLLPRGADVQRRPIVAKAPILVLIMGNGMEPKITIAALVCFFPTLVNMVRGLESVNPQAMELMRVLSASKTEIFFRLRLFNALPYLFSALRISASMCVIGAVVGEWIGANTGIGAMIIQATFNFDSRCCTPRSS
jgi:NitT/TauT family transport system permease protein